MIYQKQLISLATFARRQWRAYGSTLVSLLSGSRADGTAQTVMNSLAVARRYGSFGE